jgi:hypothetical protein
VEQSDQRQGECWLHQAFETSGQLTACIMIRCLICLFFNRFQFHGAQIDRGTT